MEAPQGHRHAASTLPTLPDSDRWLTGSSGPDTSHLTSVAVPTPEDTKRCVLDAIEIGYRSIDTAQAYYNEEGVGSALASCGLPREEFFLTTKVWITNAGYEKAKASIQESMEKLQTDYLDLLLIHQPFGDYYGTYRAMEELYEAGKLPHRQLSAS